MAEHEDRPETRLTSVGRKSKEHFGVVNTPVYRASTILYPDVASLEARDRPYTYGRSGTPTVESLEEVITAATAQAVNWSMPAFASDRCRLLSR